MSEFSFMEQMEENVRFNLIFPYHIDFEKLVGHDYYNPKYSNAFHCHTFEEVLRKAYLEPKAFHLTIEDMKYYSTQEYEFIQKVLDDEGRKLDEGMELVNLDLNEETLDMLMAYKLKYDMTFEEAVVDILKKVLENPEVLKGEENGKKD